MLASEIRAIEARCRAQFSYTPDDGPDTWRSHGDEVLAGKPWQDDCDGLASTVLDLLGRDGLPQECRYRLIVSALNVTHMIGCAVDADGKFWIVGDTLADGPYPAEQMTYRPREYNRLSEAYPAPIWRDGVPWL